MHVVRSEQVIHSHLLAVNFIRPDFDTNGDTFKLPVVVLPTRVVIITQIRLREKRGRSEGEEREGKVEAPIFTSACSQHQLGSVWARTSRADTCIETYIDTYIDTYIGVNIAAVMRAAAHSWVGAALHHNAEGEGVSEPGL